MRSDTKSRILGSFSEDKLVYFQGNYWGRCTQCDNLIWFAEFQSSETHFKVECSKCLATNQASSRQFKTGIFIEGTVALADPARYTGAGHIFKAMQPFGSLPPVCFLERGYEEYKKGNFPIQHIELSQDQWQKQKLYGKSFFVCPKCRTSDIGLIQKNTWKHWVCKHGHFFEWMGFEPGTGDNHA
ncbi:MAG: hypothetical protein PHH61_05450 [Candidatus Nanoarchaeia archaeon]|nr:hypothetical protein [Candidatus Nanoarchaeia archaeon]